MVLSYGDEFLFILFPGGFMFLTHAGWVTMVLTIRVATEGKNCFFDLFSCWSLRGGLLFFSLFHFHLLFNLGFSSFP